jgi:hypothetical protein
LVIWLMIPFLERWENKNLSNLLPNIKVAFYE